MGVGLGQGLVAFLSGVQEGAEKIDERMAANMKRIQESNPDENLKSKYAAEYAKFDEDKELIASINALGGSDFSGISTPQGQALAGGYKSIEEYQKALTLNPDLRHSMPKIGQEPIFTPSTYGLSNIKKDGTTRTTLSKTFNKLFRPEVFDENQSYADTQTDTEGSLTFGDDSSATTYRRGKSDNLSEDEVTSLKSVSNRNLAQNREKTLTHNIKNTDGTWEEVTFTKNADGTTGTLREGLDDKLYAGYSETNSKPWKNPAEQIVGSSLNYSLDFYVDDNGKPIGEEVEITDTMKQLTFAVQARKTDNPLDIIEIDGGTLVGYEYVERNLIPEEVEEDGRTTARKNLDDSIEAMIIDYAIPGRTAMYDANLKRLGYTEMNKASARGLINNYNSMVQNANTGNVLNMDDYFMGNIESNSRQATFVPYDMDDMLDASVDYFKTQEYYKKLKTPLAFEAYVNGQAMWFANEKRISKEEALEAVEIISKLGIKDGGGLTFNPFVFDRRATAFVWKGENKNVRGMVQLLTEWKKTETGRTQSWADAARSMAKVVIKKRTNKEDGWYQSSVTK